MDPLSVLSPCLTSGGRETGELVSIAPLVAVPEGWGRGRLGPAGTLGLCPPRTAGLCCPGTEAVPCQAWLPPPPTGAPASLPLWQTWSPHYFVLTSHKIYYSEETSRYQSNEDEEEAEPKEVRCWRWGGWDGQSLRE